MPERSILDVDGAEWRDMGPHPAFHGPLRATKVLTAPSGQRLTLVRFTGIADAHFHLRSNSFYMTGGRMALRDREVRQGMWGLEPVGAIHAATSFEDAIYGYGMSPGSGGGRPGVITMPPGGMPAILDKAGFAVEELDSLVDSAALEWTPTEVEGVSMKLLHVFEGSSAFAALYRAEAGASLPKRRHVGPIDMFLFRGGMNLHDATAKAGDWIHHPAGSVEPAATFPVAAEWLQNSYGPVLDLGPNDTILRMTDGFSLALAAGKRLGEVSVA